MLQISINDTLINLSWNFINHVNIKEKEAENEYKVYTYIPKERGVWLTHSSIDLYPLWHGISLSAENIYQKKTMSKLLTVDTVKWTVPMII